MSRLLTIAAVAAMLSAGAIVPAATIEGDDGRTFLDRLITEANDAVNRTLDDLSPVPLDAVEVYGMTEDHRVHRVIVLVRVEGDLDMRHLHVIHQAEPLAWEVTRVLRDQDGSMDDGRGTSGDLLRIEADLPFPLPAGAGIDLLLNADGHRSVTWSIEAPRNTGPDLVAMEHQERL